MTFPNSKDADVWLYEVGEFGLRWHHLSAQIALKRSDDVSLEGCGVPKDVTISGIVGPKGSDE